nr:uncharacterized protein LOC113812322 [Penaeus vannamei]
MVIGGSNINNIRYADDMVLLATSVEQLQGLVDKVVLESAKKGLCVNTKKTVHDNGWCDREIKRRIAKSRETFSKIKKILCNPKITVATRLRVLECCVLPVLKYGSETWTVSKEMEEN